MSGLVFALIFAYGAYELYQFYVNKKKKIDDESRGAIRMFLFLVLYPITVAAFTFLIILPLKDTLGKYLTFFLFLLVGVLLYFVFSKIDDDIYKKRD